MVTRAIPRGCGGFSEVGKPCCKHGQATSVLDLIFEFEETAKKFPAERWAGQLGLGFGHLLTS